MKNSNKNILVALSCAFMLLSGIDSIFAIRSDGLFRKQQEKMRKNISTIKKDIELSSKEVKRTIKGVIRSGNTRGIQILVEKNNPLINQLIINTLKKEIKTRKEVRSQEIISLHNSFMIRNTNPLLDNFDLRYLLLGSLFVTMLESHEENLSKKFFSEFDFDVFFQYILEQIKKEFTHMIDLIDSGDQTKINKLNDMLNQIKIIVVRDYINAPLTDKASIDKRVYGLKAYSFIISLFSNIAPWFINSIRDEALTLAKEALNYNQSIVNILKTDRQPGYSNIFNSLISNSLNILESLLIIGDQRALEFIDAFNPQISIDDDSANNKEALFLRSLSTPLQRIKTRALQKRGELDNKNKLDNKNDLVSLYEKDITQLITKISKNFEDHFRTNDLQNDIRDDLIFTLGDVTAALSNANKKLNREINKSKKDLKEIKHKSTRTRKHHSHQHQSHQR